MLKKILTIFVITAVGSFVLTGCKGTSDESESDINTPAEYKAQAENEITKENMAAELDKLEKAVEQDVDLEE